MAGIYIHIPFCKRKCHYCNFYSLANQKNKEQFHKALLKEIALQKNYLHGEPIETIYFGGGTPSLLSISQIDEILNQIHQHYKVLSNAEIDLEANPDDLDKTILVDYEKSGINRLSIGTQAFDDDILQKLNRIHSVQQAIDAVHIAQSVGFENISIDLIYGIPGLTNQLWQQSIAQALSLNVPHLSAYHLTVEPNTALDVLIRKNKYPQPKEAEGIEHSLMLMQQMQANGYEHYEISNYALPGKYSVHNTNYWRQKSYLGLGPSAHSFDLNSRQWNVASTTKYIEALQQGKILFEKEEISNTDQYNEFVMLGLRTQWGIDIKELQSKFGQEKTQYFQKQIQKYLSQEKLVFENGIYRLSNQGKIFADGIAGDLFIAN
jgi:oxygen-independent coproporphyrinogen-3 oxidase